jgi:hypothetical protein
MCNKHSFLQDKQGKLYHGYGLIESHTLIAKIHKIQEDICNKYEYNPNNTKNNTYEIVGLKIDTLIFEPSLSDTKQIVSYINKYFPAIEQWDDYSLLPIPTEAVQLEAVKQKGWSIKCINNPSEAVQLEAVKQDGYSIQDINNPSEAVQLEAVKRKWLFNSIY